MILEAMARARKRGIATAFAVRGFGYYEQRYFENVEHAFTCSRFLTEFYRDAVGLISTPIEPPIDWASVLAPVESRAFVTFVNPSPHKGVLLFARLADMLGSRRPDIPILVVQSGDSGGSLNAIPGVDFSRYPQIMAAPPVPTPADYFALTRILVVPSVWEEPFGRVAAEAMINAIPPLVSDRGSLPHVVGGDFRDGGGGCVLPIPDSMSSKTKVLPTRGRRRALVQRRLRALGQSRSIRVDRDASAADRGRTVQRTRLAQDPCRLLHVIEAGRPTARARPEEAAAFSVTHTQCHARTGEFVRLFRRLRSWRRSGPRSLAAKSSALVPVLETAETERSWRCPAVASAGGGRRTP